MADRVIRVRGDASPLLPWPVADSNTGIDDDQTNRNDQSMSGSVHGSLGIVGMEGINPIQLLTFLSPYAKYHLIIILSLSHIYLNYLSLGQSCFHLLNYFANKPEQMI